MRWMAEHYYVSFIITDETICIHGKEEAISFSSNSFSIKSLIKQDREQRGKIESRGWLMVRKKGVRIQKRKEVVMLRERLTESRERKNGELWVKTKKENKDVQLLF